MLFSVLAMVVSMCQMRQAESKKKAQIATQLLHTERSRYALELRNVIPVAEHQHKAQADQRRARRQQQLLPPARRYAQRRLGNLRDPLRAVLEDVAGGASVQRREFPISRMRKKAFLAQLHRYSGAEWEDGQ